MPLATRLAQNESLFRMVNERIREREERVKVPSRLVGFVCECQTTGCTARVDATLDEYRDVLERSSRFIVTSGHVDPNRERVVRVADRFLVVQRTDEAS
jgi:hypothetical protein